MSKSKLYTRTGDKGETSLVSGKRIPKADPQIDLYGDVDELNSHIGYLLSLLPKSLNDDRDLLISIQHNLFNLGSMLACEKENWEKYKLPTISSSLLLGIERRIDTLDNELEPLKNFILPGGSKVGAYAHICRTFTRRVERKLTVFNDRPESSVEVLNRLSDYFFVFSRYINNLESMPETIWEPKA